MLGARVVLVVALGLILNLACNDLGQSDIESDAHVGELREKFDSFIDALDADLTSSWDSSDGANEISVLTDGSSFICNLHETRSCQVEGLFGACSQGMQYCVLDGWGPCHQREQRSRESCNNIDDDCDGLVDEPHDNNNSNFDRMTVACYDGPDGTLKIGECYGGYRICRWGDWSTCIGQVLPREEQCDGLDNDCDGDTDEGLTNACGECGPAPRELCNNIDDDCDGEVDEGTGACVCGNPLYQPIPEACDGADNDCDGRIDRNPDGTPLTKPCATGQGHTLENPNVLVDEQLPEYPLGVACAPGLSRCDSRLVDGNEVWGYFECEDEIAPGTEHCNLIDDDCDGEVDEDFVNIQLIGQVVLAIAIDVSGSMEAREISNGVAAGVQIIQNFDALGLNDAICWLVFSISGSHPYSLMPPTRGCLPGIDHRGDNLDAMTALQSFIHEPPHGASEEYTGDLIFDFARDDILDTDGDGAIDDPQWWFTPYQRGGQGGIMYPLRNRKLIIAGDEGMQGVVPMEQVLQAKEDAQIEVHLISVPMHNGFSVEESYGGAADYFYPLRDGAQAGQGIAEAIRIIEQDLQCLLR